MVTPEWIEHLSSPLRQRVFSLLTQLRKLSEARAGSLMSIGTGKPESSPPGGVTEGRRPDPDVWLLDWYLWRLGKAPNGAAREPAVLATTIEAEIRLGKRTHRVPADLSAGSLDRAAVDANERDRRIALEYEGLSPSEVALIELHRAGWCPEENVRRVRLNEGRDPETGMPLPEDRKLKGEARRTRACEMAALGLSQRQIAARLGVARPTVRRWLNRP